MNCRTSIMCLAALIALAGLGTLPAAAQPGDFFDLPDISQLSPGLPNGGASYCGVAAAADALQWLEENGYPGLGLDPILSMPGALEDFLEQLGTDMGTNPATGSGGTGSQQIVDVLQDRLDAWYPGKFDVGFVGRSTDTGEPYELDIAQALGHSFGYVVIQLNAGHLVLANVGWYVAPTNQFTGGTRCNGHWVAITGYDFVDSIFTARYVDPARNLDSIDTKIITDATLRLQDATEDDCASPCMNTRWASSWNWGRTCGSSCAVCTQATGRTGVQDNVIHIGGVRLVSRPDVLGVFGVRNLANGQSQSRNAGGSNVSTSIAIHPYVYDLYHCNPNQNLIYRTNFISNQVTTFNVQAALNQPRRLAFAANGYLFVAMGSPQSGFTLLAVRPDGSIAGSATQSTLGAIAYHEKNDLVYWWDPAANIIRRFTTQLIPVNPPLMLPIGQNFVAPGYLAAAPTNDTIYYNHAGSASIFRHHAATNAPLSPLTSTSMTNPDDMVVDSRGTLYVAQATTGPVLEFNANGMQVTPSLAGNFQATSNLAILRAVHRPLIEVYEHDSLNCDIPWDEAWIDCNNNMVPDEIDVAEGFSDDDNNNGVPDECDEPGDVTGDGLVNIVDLLAVIAAWGAAGANAADVNGDGVVNIADLLFVIAHWG